MPEIKNIFRQGVMNKDDDERLIANGQYRDAMNIEVSTSEDSDVGTVQNIMGNVLVSSASAENPFDDDLRCVGSISDEKNDVLYYFLRGKNKDFIIEHANDNSETLVFVDINKDTLKFSDENIITGISIIDNLLFWTDNVNEPRKINIDSCKSGTSDIFSQTQLVINGVSQGDIKEEHITVIKKKPNKAPTVLFTETSASVFNTFESLNFFNKTVGMDVKTASNTYPVLVTNAASSPYIVGDVLYFAEVGSSGVLPYHYQVKVEVKTVYTVANGYQYELEIIDIPTLIGVNIFDNITRDFDFTNVIESKPIFEKDFIRFALRYKYVDGEFSSFSPFTHPVFLAGVFGFHPTKDPYNLGMESRAKTIRLQDLVPSDIPNDVIQIDILFKKERSTTVYSIDSIKPDDPAPNYWQENNYAQRTILDVSYGYGPGGVLPNNTNSHANYTYSYTGEYEITTENIYAALPANQLLRPWDNVPKKALAQEITGNRLVYGNYLQNYDLLDVNGNVIKPDILVDKEDRVTEYNQNIYENPQAGLKSIKSLRHYYLGVVFGDKYGRETPVFTGRNASIFLPYDNDESPLGSDTNADKSLRLKVKLQGGVPAWASYYKYFIKQTTGEYYNLVLDRVYKSEGDEAYWLSFPSSDRNKVQEGDYFTIKKQVDIEVVVPEENKIKIIDIKNEAPDPIKYNYISLGSVGTSDLNAAGTVLGTGLFPDQATVGPMPGKKIFKLKKVNWLDQDNPDLIDSLTPSDKLAVRFSITENNILIKSKIYRIITYNEVDPPGSAQVYYNIVLEKNISQNDSWIRDGASVNTADQLRVEIFKAELKDSTEFAGRFFVKVIANAITQNYLILSQQDLFNFTTLAIADCFNFADQIGNTWLQTGANAEGLYLVENASLGTNTTSNTLTDTESEWSAVTAFNTTMNTYNSNVSQQQGWFIDSAHYIALGPGGTFNNDAFNSGYMGPQKPWNNINYEDAGQWYNPGGFYVGEKERDRPLNGFEGIVTCSVGGTNWYPRIDAGFYRTEYSGWGGGTSGTSPNFGPVGHRCLLQEVREYKVDSNGITDFQDFEGWGASNPPIDYPYKLISQGSGQTETHFMHISFACPGKQVHNGDFSALEQDITNGGWTNVSTQAIANSLDNYAFGYIRTTGIWLSEDLNSSTPKFKKYTWPMANYPNATGSNDVFNVSALPVNAAIVDKLTTAGSRFIVGSDTANIYTILGCHTRNVYNHTSWNPEFISDWDYTHGGSNGYGMSGWNTQNFPKSVAGAVHNFRKYLDINGTSSFTTSTEWEDLKNTIVNFANPNNRRVCFITQLDGDPRQGVENPLDATATTFKSIKFISEDVDLEENTIPTSPAIFETEAKEEVDLNIYYEASNALPTTLSSEPDSIQGHLLAPVGSKVYCSVNDYSILNLQNTTFSGFDFYPRVVGWQGDIVEINNPGLRDWGEPPTVGDQNGSFQGKTIRFYRDDMSYTQASIDEVVEMANIPGTNTQGNFVTKLRIKPDVHNKMVGLGWYNCFSFGNGVESNRIRDDFNESVILNGVKASTVLEEPYKEERRRYGLIYSGLYNSTSGVNNLNQFIQAEKITKDINPTYGSIQKLYSRTKDLVTLCEDKVLQIFVDRDLLFNADGNTQLLSSNRFLGTTQPFRGKFGISTNPESFAAESFRAYFTDKQRGAVLRLSIDGLTPISDAGMRDYFRDNLPKYNALYGSYDSYSGDYNLTLQTKRLRVTGIKHSTGQINEGKYFFFDLVDMDKLLLKSNWANESIISVKQYRNNKLYFEGTCKIWNQDDVNSGIASPSGGPLKGHGRIDEGTKFLPNYQSVSGGTPGDFEVGDIIKTSIIEEKTVTYSENSKGWVSFKSFVPEIAISSVKQYYTFKNGLIYKHHLNKLRNTFYNEFVESSVTPVLNSNPELVKNYNTLNYEGTQSRVQEITEVTLNDPLLVDIGGYDNNVYNDNQYYNLQYKKGWYVDSIITDKQEGSLNEFIEKEGKWFNHIKGQFGIVDNLDPAAFNFQGLGIVNDIVVITPLPTPL